VFTTILRRIFRTLVFFFAAYAFAFVPLGEKTALEHVLAIFRTPQAQRAGSELKTGAERLVKRLREQARPEDEPEPAPRRHADKADKQEASPRRPLSGVAPAPSAASLER
jgi:hypothetical protein